MGLICWISVVVAIFGYVVFVVIVSRLPILPVIIHTIFSVTDPVNLLPYLANS